MPTLLRTWLIPVANIGALIFDHLAPILLTFSISFQAIRKGPKGLLYWHQLAQFLNRIILAIIPVMSIADKAGGDIVGIFAFANLQNFTKILEFFDF